MNLPTNISEETQYKATWLELFFDLVYVAIVAQLTYFFSKHHSTPIDFLNTFLMGYMIFQSWFSTTVNRNLKQRDDVKDILVIQFEMILVMIMSLTLPIAFSDNNLGFVFFLAYGGIRFIGMKLILNYYKDFPDKAPKTKNIIGGLTIATVLWVIAGFLSAPFMYILIFSAIALDLLTPKTTGKGNKTTYLNMHHLVERFGLLVLMVMGESVLVVALANTAAGSFTPRNTVFVVCGILQMVALWWLYFPYIENKIHGIRAKHFQTLVQSHMLLLGSLVLLATGLKLLLKHEHSTLLEDMMFLGGIIGIVAFFLLIRANLTHTLVYSLQRIGIYTLGIGVIYFIYFGFHLSNVVLVLGVTSWLIFYSFKDHKKEFQIACKMRTH